METAAPFLGDSARNDCLMIGEEHDRWRVSAVHEILSEQQEAAMCQRQTVRQFLHCQGGLPQVKKRRRVGKPDAASE